MSDVDAEIRAMKDRATEMVMEAWRERDEAIRETYKLRARIEELEGDSK